MGAEEVEVVVVRKGKPGLLGLGAEEALVRVTPLSEVPTTQVSEVAQEQVSEVAQEIVISLLATLNIPATVHPTEPPPQGLSPGAQVVALDIQGEDLGILIGRRGQTLVALQYLVNLIVAQRLKSRVPLMLDVEGYKKRRYQALQSLAERIAQQVMDSGQPVTLEPMPANERRLIHLALADHSQVSTESIGLGEGRKVVILPRKSS
ncbi:MAG: RNA-binding cell elongation regulator Jag/EloR [Dehalococcoidia bacterium]